MSLTAANIVITLTVTGVFSAGERLQGFSTDDVFGTEQVTPIETAMGVDGLLSGGFVFVPVIQSYTLQADSPSNQIFEEWYNAQQVLGDTITANAFAVLTALNRAYVMNKGFLTRYSPVPDGRRILQPRRYSITWERVVPAPV